MYTQCPECESAFRVTADVLKVAAGMVRCGSCGHAFNSLDFLSEEKPKRRAPAIPELKPEPDEADELQGSTIPKSISAEQSAALLKTLDQLAGEDIRIEDTGVEWRVLDDDEEAVDEVPEDTSSETDLLTDPEVTNAFFVGDVERYRAEQDAKAAGEDSAADDVPATTDLRGTDESETDSHRETMVDIDANVADVFAEDSATPTGNESFYGTLDEQPVAPKDIFHPSATHVDELLHSSDTPVDAVLEESAGETVVDEWPEPEAASASAAETTKPVREELRFDDNTPLPDDFLDNEDDDVNGYAALPDEAAEESAQAEEDELPANVTLGDPDEWQQLLNEFDGLLSDAKPSDADDVNDGGEPDSTDDAAGDDWGELAEIGGEEQAAGDDEQSEMLEAGDDNVDQHSSEGEAEIHAEHDDEAALELSDGDDDAQPASDGEAVELVADDEADDDLPDWATQGSDDTHEGDTADDQGDDHAENEADDSIAAEPSELEADNADEEPVDLSSILDPDDEGLVDEGEEDPEHDDSDLPVILNPGEEKAEDEFDIPPQSEEEQTINMLIDQDLLSIAREDEDGFTSTIVYEESEDPLSVSSITMQGESLIEEKILQMETGSHHVTMDEADGPVPEGSVVIGAATEAQPQSKNKLVGFGILAAVLALGLILQAVHQRREQLATDPSMFAILGPVYETLGMPLKPDWDVSQWTIERTQGATDGSDQLLTILSELRNTSSKPMPYPIITVSLTDRYQETIGSLVVGPDAYLDNASVSAEMVGPGQLVEAEIPIDAPSPDTVGYSINACYREDGSQLRCAMADFR